MTGVHKIVEQGGRGGFCTLTDQLGVKGLVGEASVNRGVGKRKKKDRS